VKTVSEFTGYERDKCQAKVSKKCEGRNAGYQRRAKYAQQGEWLDACEECARVPYEQPAQFVSVDMAKIETRIAIAQEDPATVGF